MVTRGTDQAAQDVVIVDDYPGSAENDAPVLYLPPLRCV